MLTHRRNDGDLLWFFGQGVSSFERSTFGGMLERAEMFGSVQKRRRGPLTVRPRSMQGGGEPTYEPDERVLVRYGDVSRRLSRVETADPVARKALELYYGDEGSKWSEHPRGRWVALFPLTHSGRILIEHARNTATAERAELSDGDRLRIEVELDRAKADPKSARHALITAAQNEAVKLQARADAAWLRASFDAAPAPKKAA